MLASVITGGGSGSISANNNISIASLENTYYSYEMHQKTSIDVGMLALQVAVTVAAAVVTAGAAAAAAPFLFASITAGSAAWGAVTAVGTQYVISTAKAHGEGGTEQIQSGDATITIKTSNTLIASSLLFKEELNVKAGNNVDMQTANIKSSNMEQETKQSSSTSLVVENIDIVPDYKKIAIKAAISGVITGASTWANEYFKPNLEKGGPAVQKPDQKVIDNSKAIEAKAADGKTNPQITKEMNMPLKDVEAYREKAPAIKLAEEKGITSYTANNIAKAYTTNDIHAVDTPIPSGYTTNDIHAVDTPIPSAEWDQEGGWLSIWANLIPGMNSMATNIHDPWATAGDMRIGMNIATIAPAIVVQYCSVVASVCGTIFEKIMGPALPIYKPATTSSTRFEN